MSWSPRGRGTTRAGALAGPVSGLGLLRDEERAVRALGRLAGILFVVCGLLVELSLPFVTLPDGQVPIFAALGAAALAIGVGTLLVPWHRWGARHLLVLPVLALALLGVPTEGNGGQHFIVFYLLVFLWTGLTQPRRWVFRLAPAALLSFLLGFVLQGQAEVVFFVDFLVVLAVSVMVGALVATLVADDRAAADDVDRVFAGTRALGSAEGVTAVAASLERTLCELLGADAVLSFLGEGGDRRRFLLVGDRATPAPSSRPTHGAARAMIGALSTVSAEDVLGAETIARMVPSLSLGEPVFVADVASSAVIATRGPSLDGICSLFVLPLPAVDRVTLGFTVIAWERPISGLSDFGGQAAALLVAEAAAVFEREQHVAQMSRDALTDPLTGLLNRRAIERELDTLEPGDVVVVIDLDHFKAVNDTHGHAAGDRTLRTLAACLVDSCRKRDWCGRLGGEEFVLVVRSAGAQPGRAVVRLRERWHSLDPLTTFSAGVAVHGAGHHASDTLTAADEALYRAKDLGRDRVEVRGTTGEPTP